jgi:hypothetical protein
VPRSKSEQATDARYRTDGWYSFSDGWPDRVYARIKENGELETKFVEIKSRRDRVRLNQEFVHSLLLSKGIKVEIEPPSKAPKQPAPPLDVLLKMIQALEQQRGLTPKSHPATLQQDSEKEG